MKINISETDLDFLISCVEMDMDRGIASVGGFDTSKHSAMLKQLDGYLVGYGLVPSVPSAYLVEYTFDNGKEIADYRSVCLAFDKDDAREIIFHKLVRCARDCASVTIKNISLLSDDALISEKVG